MNRLDHSDPPLPPALPPWQGRSWMATVALAGAAACFLYPFLWMLLGAFKDNLEIFRPLQFWPGHWDWSHYQALLQGTWIPFWTVFANSLLAAGLQAAGAVLLASLAGYVFARHRLRGQKLLFLMSMTVIVMPPQTLAIPLFTWLNTLGLMDSLWGVILPGMVSGLAVLYFTQVFRQVPGELIDMARVEGAGEWKIYRTFFPLIRPALISFGLVEFILAWHQHLIPLLVLNSDRHQTLPLALATLYGSSLRFPYAVLMAGSVFTVLPTALLFALLYKKLQASLAELLPH